MENEKLNKEGKATIELMIADGIISKECAEKYFPELTESEDEKIRKWVINEIKIKHHCLDEEDAEFVDKAIAWLEKKGEQNHAWSEEDEKILNLIIARLHSHPNVEVEEYDKDYRWLNSLRPQTTWKPSDEMLEALYRATPKCVMEKSEDEMLLNKLYQGLKYGKVLSEK